MAPRTQKQLAQLMEERRLLILEATLKIFSQKEYKHLDNINCIVVNHNNMI